MPSTWNCSGGSTLARKSDRVQIKLLLSGERSRVKSVGLRVLHDVLEQGVRAAVGTNEVPCQPIQLRCKAELRSGFTNDV